MRTPEFIELQRKVTFMQHTMDRLADRMTEVEKAMDKPKPRKKAKDEDTEQGL